MPPSVFLDVRTVQPTRYPDADDTKYLYDNFI